MTFTGEIRHGVEILRDAPHFERGAQVRVEIDQVNPEPARGSAQVVLKYAGGWEHIATEVDAAIEDLRQSKQAELIFQQAAMEDEL